MKLMYWEKYAYAGRGPMYENPSGDGLMTGRTYTSRRTALKVIGIGGGVLLGSGPVTADHGGSHPGPTFFARLSDNPSIPGHDKVRSRGRGRVEFEGDSDGTELHYELAVANLEDGEIAAHIHGEGRADGPIWVTLYESEPINDEKLTGTIRDDDVDESVGTVQNLIWNELVEGNGVVNVHTELESGGEIAGIVRPRPVGGWIAV